MNDRDLSQAREFSLRNVELFSRERSCLADLLLSLAEFDRRLLHRALGHSSLFDYLHRELGMSRGMAHYRLVATRLVQRFPEVVEPLRDGRLCITTVIELARVMTEENRAEALPRFFGLSREEARQVAAEFRPAEVVPRQTVVTTDARAIAGSTIELELTHPEGGAAPPHPPRPVLADHPTTTRTRVEPLTAVETRLHITVSPAFVALLKKARAGESRRNPWTTDEQILTAALELLVAKQGKRKACVPARVKREVVKRDEGKCQWTLPDGTVCGATAFLEIDHVVPRGRGGSDTVDNCRVLCGSHNLEAARQAYGDEFMDRFAPRAPAAGPAPTPLTSASDAAASAEPARERRPP